MRENQENSNPVLKRTRVSSEKIKKLSDFLGDGAAPDIHAGNKTLPQLDMNMSGLAAALFAKAPVEFLEQRTLAELSDITNECFEVLSSFLSDTRKVCV